MDGMTIFMRACSIQALQMIREDAMDYLARKHKTEDERAAADLAGKELLAVERELTAREVQF